MYLGYQDNKIKFYTDKPLNSKFYLVDKWEETQEKYILDGDEYVLKTQTVIDKQYKEKRTAEILARLDELDLKSIRAIRANDTEYIQAYETEAIALREELRSLDG